MNCQPARILVVDDDEQIRHLLREFLQEEGMAVWLAADAAQMEERLREEGYDLVILDLMMPGENGLSALRRMESDAPAVIMLSAYGTVDDRVLGLELAPRISSRNPASLVNCWRGSARPCDGEGRGPTRSASERRAAHPRPRGAFFTTSPAGRSTRSRGRCSTRKTR